MRIWKTLFCSFIVQMHFVAQAAVWDITYPKNINHETIHNQYAIALLDLALQKTGVRYRLQQTDNVLTQQRAIQLLSDNRQINVMWSMTDVDRESLLTPIRVPIYKGLIGWRVLLLHETNQNQFANLGPHSMRELTLVQGLNWPDNKILRSNGFNVVNASDHLEAFQLMRDRQVSLFARSVIEVLDELGKPELTNGLLLEPKYVLQYPTAVYFFVNPGDRILRQLIQQGLAQAVKDGTMDALFEQTYEKLLAKIELTDRIKIPLKNPLLPKSTPVGDIQLWYVQ